PINQVNYMILFIKIKSKNGAIHTAIHIGGRVHFSYELNNRKKLFLGKTVHQALLYLIFK
ncbi:TPA: hypothetical protein ACH2L6_005286, partial [Klebsiella pneumoniae]